MSAPSQWYINQLVCIEPRTWAGCNRPGGVGRITNIHYAEGFIESVDVKYLVGTSTDKRVDLQFVKPHEDLGRQSRSRRGREFFQASPAKRKIERVERSEQNQTGRRKTQEQKVKRTKLMFPPAPTPAPAPVPVPAEDSDEPTMNFPQDVPCLLECNEEHSSTVSPLHLDEGIGFEKKILGGASGTLAVKKALYPGLCNHGTVVATCKDNDDESAKTSYILRKMVKDNFCSTKKEASGRTNLQDAVKAAKMAPVGIRHENYVLEYDVDQECSKLKALAKERSTAATIVKDQEAVHNDENDEISQTKATIQPTMCSPELLLKKRAKRRPLPLNKSSPARRMLVSNRGTNDSTKIRPSSTRIPLQELHWDEINRADSFVRNVVGTKVSADVTTCDKPDVSVAPLLDEARLETFGRLLWDLFDKYDETLTREQLASEMNNFSSLEIDHYLKKQSSCNKIMMVDEGVEKTIYRI